VLTISTVKAAARESLGWIWPENAVLFENFDVALLQMKEVGWRPLFRERIPVARQSPRASTPSASFSHGERMALGTEVIQRLHRLWNPISSPHNNDAGSPGWIG